jgi:8-oxo-dGTP diphosphatase
MVYKYEYPRPAVTVDIIVVCKDEKKLLLIERGQQPFKGKWAFPGGFVGIDEELEDAAKRELFEETSLKIKQLTQFKAYGTIGRDPRHRTISIVYYTFIESSKNYPPKARDDASKAKWFKIEKLPELAFDHTEIFTDFLNQTLKSIYEVL